MSASGNRSSYDNILTHIGGLGLYQRRILLLAVVACAGKSIHILSTIFTMGAQDFRCAISGLPNDTFHIRDEAHMRMLNASIPFDSSEEAYSQCHRFQTEEEAGSAGMLNSTSRDLVTCTKWVYSTDIFVTSIISQLDLVCDHHIYTTHANMMTMTGMMIGSLVSGVISDRFGRKKTFLFFFWLHLSITVAMAFVRSVPLFLVLRLITASSSVAFFMTACILCMEMVSPKKRTLAGMMAMFGWSLGMFTLVLAAFLVRDWQTLQLVLSCPMVIVGVSYIWLMPESPRWLLSKGRYSEARAILQTMSKVNKREIPEKMLMSEVCTEAREDQTEEYQPPAKGENMWRLLKSPVLVIRLIILAYGWLINSMVYYGLTLNVGSIIEGDIYLNFLVMSVLELIAYVCLVLSLAGTLGRKPVFCVCVLLGGLACLSTILPIVLEVDASWINMVLSNLGKFFITSSFALVWIYTPEVLPTQLRQSGLGVCSFTGRVGGMISPYIASLNTVIAGPMGRVLPLLIFGLAAICSGMFSLFLPETSRRKLPETLEEAKSMKWRKQGRQPDGSLDSQPC
ncbi:organic cation transporter protein [Plakobranchus ocellatus]|uniref:Organic cation transporter protein n=1 Tax=Plakobranchus ocellatus TaxID=259542 RepID=A0AAV4AVF5_9GAST|nr:organic cation transporter protein [Plakobranchus ocellatus]